MLNSQMAVNLLGLAILAEQSSQCPHPSHPYYLLRESGIRCTFPFTIAWTRVGGKGCVAGEGEAEEGEKEEKGMMERERVKRQHIQPHSRTLIAILQYTCIHALQ